MFKAIHYSLIQNKGDPQVCISISRTLANEVRRVRPVEGGICQKPPEEHPDVPWSDKARGSVQGLLLDSLQERDRNRYVPGLNKQQRSWRK